MTKNLMLGLAIAVIVAQATILIFADLAFSHLHNAFMDMANIANVCLGSK